jgi:DNA-binding MarR family transcriptional regulator
MKAGLLALGCSGVRRGRALGPRVAFGVGGVQKSESMAGLELSRDVHGLSAGDEWIRRWLACLLWQRRAGRALKPLKLTFTQWLVLDAMAGLIREYNDAVSQIQVARHLQMGKATVCRVMQRLARKGLVDQAPEFTGPSYRIHLTKVGDSLTRQGRSQIDAVSAAWSPSETAVPRARSPDVRRDSF